MAGHAQKTPELDYALYFGNGISPVQEKHLQEGLKDQDPGAELWVDPPTNSALLRMHGTLDRIALQQSVQASGLTITAVDRILTAQPNVILVDPPMEVHAVPEAAAPPQGTSPTPTLDPR